MGITAAKDTSILSLMVHSRAIGMIVNTRFLVGNWPYKALIWLSLSKATHVKFPTRKLVFTIILIACECSININQMNVSQEPESKANIGFDVSRCLPSLKCVF